jgi:ribonuclease P protein component
MSRRAAKRAVDRNRLKRIAREIFRTQEHLPHWDFVVMAKPLAATTPSAALRESLTEHFERLRQKAVLAGDG